MKAVVYERYGPPEVLQLKDVNKPTPKEDEVLIKVYATTVHVGDTRMRSFRVPLTYWLPMRLFLGIRKPKKTILGMELSGIIEERGKDVTVFKKGDEVFGLTGFGFGGYAEYKCIRADGGDENKGMIALKPSNLSFEQAAAVPAGALTALAHMRKVNISKGQKILIYGASGSVGTYAVQIAHYFGAEVTGVCSTSNVTLVKSLGAHTVIDYTTEDFTKSGKTYDVVFDAVFKASKSRCKKVLKENGVYDSSHTKVSKLKVEDLHYLKDLIEKQKLRPVIDKIYPLDKIVEAHRYVDTGHKRGNVAITVP
ncbi:MAG: NAD(P)-dependent alcohol dehydrogenase [Candidatus Thermoplasmatota archaeon]|nr:NAD(P)-dependent alcohol dehydrogenase [Candidatus Thermoplasmatota archaeon]